MTTDSPSRETQPYDYWVLRFWRDFSVIFVFVIGVIAQAGISRVLVFTYCCGIVAVVVGHVMTAGRYFPAATMKKIFQPLVWSVEVQRVIGFYYAFVGFMAVSLIWSPLPIKASRDLLVLSVIIPLSYFLASEHRRVILASFATLLRSVIFIAAIILILEMVGVTSFHTLDSLGAELYDLNRNAILLGLLCWLPALFIKNPRVDKAIYLLGVIIAGVAVFFSQSEAAKLGFLVAMVVGALLYVLPWLGRYIFYLMAVVMLVFPFILSQVDTAVDANDAALFKNGHAQHRVAIWLGYRDLIVKKPILGWGARADRQLGKTGAATLVATARGYPEETTNPHNIILEIWINMGVVGALLFSLGLISLERLFRTFEPSQRIVGTQIVTAAFVVSNVGSSYLQGWWLASLAMVSIAFSIAIMQSTQEDAHRRVNTNEE